VVRAFFGGCAAGTPEQCQQAQRYDQCRDDLPELSKSFRNLDAEATPGSPADSSARSPASRRRWETVASAAGIRLD